MKKYNLIYILADDMGYGDVSGLNEHCAFKTPNIDRMIDNGMFFTDAHATSSVCTPSRYGILTGRYNWRSHLKKGVLGGYSKTLIEENRSTIASMLRECGYQTACIGKWHLGFDWQTPNGEPVVEAECHGESEVDFHKPVLNGPITKGFDYFYGISASLDMPPYCYIENDRVTEIPSQHYEGKTDYENARPGPIAPGFKHIDVLPTLTKKVKEKINEYKNNPFFIYFPLPAPHTPILPTEEFLGKSKTNVYGDFCLMVDDVVGQVVQSVKQAGIEENTIIVFTADNGCSPMARYDVLAEFGHNPSYVFRGTKADIYEGGHRIPLVVQCPDLIQKSSRSDKTVCLCDLFATMAELNGYKIEENTAEDSFSCLGLLTGHEENYQRKYIVHQSIKGELSIRDGDFKLCMCAGSGGWSKPNTPKEIEGAEPFQLFDLKNDISETRNLYREYPEKFREMKKALIDIILNGRSTEGEKQENNGEFGWIEEKLDNWEQERRIP